MARPSGGGPAPTEAQALERLIGFGRELRRRGLAVCTGRILTFCHATAALGAVDRDDLYWAGRASLISRPEDAEAFDRAFDEWFREGVRIALELPASTEALESLERAEASIEPRPGGPGEEPRLAERWRSAEEDELAEC